MGAIATPDAVGLDWQYIVGTLMEHEDLSFEWDHQKARSNRRKHGIGFEEAASAFADEWALLIGDPDRHGDEDRFVLLGLGSALRLLVVVHSYRESDAVIRIISARRATQAEQAHYPSR